MKKLLSLLLAAVMLLSLTSVASAEEPVHLTMWTFPFSSDANAAEERAMYDSMTAAFKEATGIDVTVEIIPWGNRETKMLTAIAANAGPDVMYLNSDIMRLFQAYGILSPITDYIPAESLARYSDEMIQSNFVMDGQLYGLPVLIDLGCPVYNLDLLAQIGMTADNLPTTWDEFDAMLAALKEKDIFGVYINYPVGLISGYAYPMFFSEGCDVITEDGQVVVDNDAGRKVIGRLKDWYQKGYTPVDSVSIADDDANFIEGKVAACLSPKGAGFYTRVAPNLTFNWAPGPILKGDAGQYGVSTVAAMGVARTCQNVEAAAKWIDFFTNEENGPVFTKFGGYISPIVGATNYLEGTGYDIILNSLQCVRGEAKHAASRTLGSVWVPDIQAIVSGDVDFEEGLAKLKTDMEGIVATIEALSN